MKSTARNLFKLVLGDALAAQRAGQSLSEQQTWNEALSLGIAWKVVPKFARVLRQHNHLAVPPEVRERLRQQLTATALQSGYVAKRAAHVFAALADEKVSAVGFKGVATLARLHNSPADRMLSDIDIIIREEAFEPAIKALASIGFKPSFGDSIEDWRSFSTQRIRQDNYTIALADPEGLEVDLHFRLDGRIGLTAEHLWDRAGELKLCGKPVRVVAPEDAILLLAHHSLRSHFSPFPTVRDLVDLDGYWHANHLRLDIGFLGAEAARLELGEALSAMFAMLVSAGCLQAQDVRLSAFADASGQAGSDNTQRLLDWFLFRLENPEAGSEALLDLFLLARTPASLKRWFSHRFMISQELRSASWHAELERHRFQRGKSDATRIFDMLKSLNRIGLRRLPLLWSVLRLQRKALRASTPRIDGHNAG